MPIGATTGAVSGADGSAASRIEPWNVREEFATDRTSLPGVHYELLISEEARAQLRDLPDETRRNIGYRLQLLQNDFVGDVKRLKGQRSHYRLRVGDYRILIRLEGARIEVFSVKQRNDAYE